MPNRKHVLIRNLTQKMLILMRYYVMRFINDGDIENANRRQSWVFVSAQKKRKKLHACGCSFENGPSISRKCVALEYGVRESDIGILCSILITCENVIGDDYIAEKFTQRGDCNMEFL